MYWKMKNTVFPPSLAFQFLFDFIATFLDFSDLVQDQASKDM